MHRRWFKFAKASVLLLALSIAGCDLQETGPSAPEAPIAATTPITVDGLSFNLINDLSGLIQNVTTSKLIGLDGGSITLLGHTLTVPLGAVTKPTLFVMIVGSDGIVSVDLFAFSIDLLGRRIDIGGRGFNKPVDLSLYYGRSQVSDPSKLFIAHIEGSRITPLPSTVNTTKKTVSTKLEHFSKYAMMSN